MTDREILIQYMLMKVRQEDWHGVSDAANDLREMDAKGKEMSRLIPSYIEQGLRIEQLERELAEAKRNYMDLIMSVGKAYPNETRHQTALRYIRECETPSTDQAKCSAITVRENE